MVVTPNPATLPVSNANAVAEVFLVLIGFLIGGWWLGAAIRGSTDQLGPSFWVDLIALVGRGAIVVALLAVMTASLVFVTRNTVGAVFIWFGYLVAVEGILAGRFPGLRPGLLGENLAAFLQGKDVIFERSGFPSDRLIAHPGPGLVRLVAITLVLAGGAILAFRRRDVT